MIKSLLLIAVMGVTASAMAGISVSQPVKIDIPAGAAHPILSPDGSKMLFTTADHTGLSILDMTTGVSREIADDPAAGFNPAFSADSRSVVFRTADVRDGLTVRDARKFSLTDGSTSVIQDFNRSTVAPQDMVGDESYAIADYKVIKIINNGKESSVTPLADGYSYLWASLSPDGSKLLFTEPFMGVFIADADGSNPVKIAAKGDYPAWVDNNTVAYVLSHDDGYVILDSTLMVYDVKSGSASAATAGDMIVGEASAAAGKVVFSTLDGCVYSISVSNL